MALAQLGANSRNRMTRRGRVMQIIKELETMSR